MEIFYKPSVSKQLKKIPKSEIKKIAKKLILLAENPYSGKPLKREFEGEYSLKVWPYRIIYHVQGKKIIILSIAHRQNVYKV